MSVLGDSLTVDMLLTLKAEKTAIQSAVSTPSLHHETNQRKKDLALDAGMVGPRAGSLAGSLVFSQYHYFVSIINVSLHKRLAFQWTPINDIDLFELSNFSPNFRVNLISAATISMPCYKHNFLQLVFR